MLNRDGCAVTAGTDTAFRLVGQVDHNFTSRYARHVLAELLSSLGLMPFTSARKARSVGKIGQLRCRIVWGGGRPDQATDLAIVRTWRRTKCRMLRELIIIVAGLRAAELAAGADILAPRSV